METSSGKSKYGSILNRKTQTICNTPTPTPTPTTTASVSSSSFKSVCLHRWWLAKPINGQQGLAVAGFSSREGKSVRAFCSAAISKRHDATTVEAADGFRISIVGFIDEHLTHQNGFSLEVCSRFHFGFPYDWEEYDARGPTEVLSMSTNDAAKDTIKTHSHNSHQESDWFTLTMKAADDLFKCSSEMGYNESSSSPEYNDAKLSQAANMDSFQPRSLNDPPSPREHDNINRPLKSYHIMPTKRKIIDLVDTERSSSSEEINVDSAAAALELLVETPPIPKVDGNSKIIGDKPWGLRRITRSMTQVKTRK